VVRREELADEQGSLREPLFDHPPIIKWRSKPRRYERDVMSGVLWILRSEARWCDLPTRFSLCQTCCRRFQQWVKDGMLKSVLETLAEDLRTRGNLDLSECFIDGGIITAKKESAKS
jgi:transposase